MCAEHHPRSPARPPGFKFLLCLFLAEWSCESYLYSLNLNFFISEGYRWSHIIVGHTLHMVSTEILFIITHYFYYFRFPYFILLRRTYYHLRGTYFPCLSFYFGLSTSECKLHGDRDIFLFCFLLGSAYTVLAHSTTRYIFVKWKKNHCLSAVLGVQKGWLTVGNYEVYNVILASGDHWQDVARGVDYWVVWRESLLELQKSKRP